MPNSCIIKMTTTKDDFDELLSGVSVSFDGIHYVINLNDRNNINKLIYDTNFPEYVVDMEIWFEDRLLFEGYDNLEYGKISKNISLPKDFISNYVEDETCMISSQW